VPDLGDEALSMDSIRALLLMGGQHDQPFYYAELAGILAGEGGVDLRITRDLSVLSPATLEQFDVVVNWSTFVDAESREVQALLESVRRGTGLVALHGGNATFWNSAEYLTMLGSRFLGHDRRCGPAHRRRRPQSVQLASASAACLGRHGGHEAQHQDGVARRS